MCNTHYQMKYRGKDPESRVLTPEVISVDECWVGDCAREAESKKLCGYHFKRARMGKLEVPEELGVKMPDKCKFKECEDPGSESGRCHTHYIQFLKGEEMTKTRAYGVYSRGTVHCFKPGCKKRAKSQELCETHISALWKYKITLEKYKELWRDPVCSNPGCEETKRLCIDHNHETGEVRDLLCTGCNSALGMIKEDQDRIHGLSEYLKTHSKEHQ